MFRDSILRAPRRSAALVLVVAGFVIAAPNAALADGDLVSRRGAVRRAATPPAAAPSKDPARDVVILDPTRPPERRPRLPGEITPAAQSPAPGATQAAERGWSAALLGWWARFGSE